MIRRAVLLAIACTGFHLCAQTPPAPQPDVLVFTNGEKLIGHFEHAHAKTVTFKSDSVGEVNVEWSKIKELHSAKPFAVVRRGVELARRSDLSRIPQGAIDMAGQKVVVTPPSGAPETIPVAEAAHIVDVPAFQQEVLHNPGFFEAWKGAFTAGATLVQATQESHTVFGAVNLVRAIPGETWLDARNRTIFNFNGSEGSQLQPGEPPIKTEILHSDLERDEYFQGSRFYGFGQAAFDHNYAQGLDLQQIYSGGVGVTAVKKANEALDFKASISYERQAFQAASSDRSLAVSVFTETFNRKFARGIQFIEQISGTPAWTAGVYSTAANASLNLPVYKRFAFTLGVLDTYLNDPPPAFKKNSLQVTTGLTYSLK
jgi:hypothetical protein